MDKRDWQESWKHLRFGQGCLLFVAAAFVVANGLVDLLYSVTDPPVRYQ
jgi:ABC-type dipeptide/oligopeptide/nickel transport system permease component